MGISERFTHKKRVVTRTRAHTHTHVQLALPTILEVGGIT